MDEDVRYPEVLDHVRVDVDLPPGPVCAVIEDHPVLGPAHVVAESEGELLQTRPEGKMQETGGLMRFIAELVVFKGCNI